MGVIHPSLSFFLEFLMLRVHNVAERCMTVSDPNPVAVTANTPTLVIKDQTRGEVREIAYRYVQNNTNGNMYYTFGFDKPSDTVHHGIIPTGGQLDCSNHRLSVYVYAPNAGTAIPSIFYRSELNFRNSFADNKAPAAP
jgi:hypothetical protein